MEHVCNALKLLEIHSNLISSEKKEYINNKNIFLNVRFEIRFSVIAQIRFIDFFFQTITYKILDLSLRH